MEVLSWAGREALDGGGGQNGGQGTSLSRGVPLPGESRATAEGRVSPRR